MPGASLWLVPRDKVAFVNEVQELITKTVPSNFTSKLKERHVFTPHVTLTSDIDPPTTYQSDSSQSPQQWLDSLTFPTGLQKEANEVILEMDHVEAGDAFFQKLTIAINQNDNLSRLAAQTRQQVSRDNADEESAAAWAEKQFRPHLSLMYADLTRQEVKDKIPLIELQIGWGLGSLFDCCGGTLSQGGEMVLVDTSKPVSEWEVMARRETPWVMWKMSRNLA